MEPALAGLGKGKDFHNTDLTLVFNATATVDCRQVTPLNQACTRVAALSGRSDFRFCRIRRIQARPAVLTALLATHPRPSARGLESKVEARIFAAFGKQCL